MVYRLFALLLCCCPWAVYANDFTRVSNEIPLSKPAKLAKKGAMDLCAKGDGTNWPTPLERATWCMDYTHPVVRLKVFDGETLVNEGEMPSGVMMLNLDIPVSFSQYSGMANVTAHLFLAQDGIVFSYSGMIPKGEWFEEVFGDTEKNIRLPIKTRAVAKIADSAVIAKINNGMVATEKTVFSFDRYTELNDMKQKYRIEVTVENKDVP